MNYTEERFKNKTHDNKRYYTAASNLRFDAAFRGKPQGIKPFVSSLARSCPRKRGRDLAPFVNNPKSTLLKKAPKPSII